MIDYAGLRRQLVDNQIRTSAVTDHAIIQAFLAVPRERFVAESEQPFAYTDRELLMSRSCPGRRMTGAVQQARLIQSLAPAPTARVLVVGAGTGYSAAVLSRMVGAVVALEENAELAATARATLAACGYANVEVVTGPLTAGWPGAAPYASILVDGSVERVPDALVDQLKPEGSLAAIEQDGRASRAVLRERTGGRTADWPAFDAWATPLPGFEKTRPFVF